MLAFYDEEYNPIVDPVRHVFEGSMGGVSDKMILIRNDDVSKYYTDLLLSYENTLYEDYGIEGTTGWGVKLYPGSSQPTEGQWDMVGFGESISLPSIGSTEMADTTHYYAFWVRVVCPGNTQAQIRKGQKISLWFNEKMVGA